MEANRADGAASGVLLFGVQQQVGGGFGLLGHHRRLHGETGLVPPAEFEDDFYQQESVSSDTEALVPSL